jgi:hypothetical protein
MTGFQTLAVSYEVWLKRAAANMRSIPLAHSYPDLAHERLVIA